MNLIFTLLITTSFAEEPTAKSTTFIDFEEVSLSAELPKPSLTIINGDRTPAKPDILIIDIRQEVLLKQIQDGTIKISK